MGLEIEFRSQMCNEKFLCQNRNDILPKWERSCNCLFLLFWRSLSVSLPLSLSLFLSLCLSSSLSISVCLSPHSSFLFFCTLLLRLMYKCNFNPAILKCKESSVMRYQVCHKALQFQFSCNFQLPCTTYLVYSD